ncbi:hypothetical protein ABBQ32_009341 [Trebouxia sp. C0010 RCD-2024]
MSGAGAAKSQLNAFYQRCKAPIPNYECKSSGQGFKCTIICPSVHTSEGSIELQIFSGKGPTKKGSQAAAAAEAVKFLQDQPLFAAKKPFSESLWETVKSNLSDQSVYKDNELEAHIILAQMFNDGWLPVQQTLSGKSVRAWLKEYYPEAAQHPAEALQLLLLKLQEQSKETDESLALSPDGKYVRRKRKYERLSAAELGFCKATKAVQISLQFAAGSKHAGVMVPADVRAPVHVMEHDGGGDPWRAIAQALGVEPHDLLFWEKVAKVVHAPRLPGFQSQEKPQPLLKEFEKALGPPNSPSRSPTKGPPTPQAVAEGLATDSSATMLPSESLNPPVMYSSTTQISEPSTFNARASWLVGKPVHGNAYLTYTKIRHTGWLVPAVVFNSDFTLRVFWQWVHGLLPEVEYVNRAGSALVSRQPCVFRHPKAWWGAEPLKVLSELCTPGLCAVEAPASIPESDLATQPASKQPVTKAVSAQQNLDMLLKPQEETQQLGAETLHICKLQAGLQFVECILALAPDSSIHVKLKGSGALLTASAQHSSEAPVAKQQAALDLIHQLQHAVVAMLTASQPDKAPVATTATNNSSGNTDASPVMKTLHQGDLENSMPEIGNVVKVQYQLVLDAQVPGQTSQDLNIPLRDADGAELMSTETTQPVLEQCSTLRFEWGGGGVIPEIPSAVYRLGTAGRAIVPVKLPLGGPELLRGCCPWADCNLHLTYLGHRYPVSAAPTAPLFDPPLALQRHALVAGVMGDSGVIQMVDLGCGEGKLLEHFIRSQDCPSLTHMVGIDVTGEAVQRAGRKVAGAYKQAQDPLSHSLHQLAGLAEGAGKKIAEAPANKELPSAQLYHGDIATSNAMKPEFWGSLAGVDGAALVEVVEHLDPTPLHNLGPCLLGGLQPKLLVVTTPNREYNAVLHQLGNALLPNKLRNTDHRFEWTRAEFQGWAQGLAEEHGYTVKFWGAGKAIHEDRALAALGLQPPGFASQAAVFRRKSAGVQGMRAIPEGGPPQTSFGRLVAAITSSGEPQVMMGSKRPSPHHQSPVDKAAPDATGKRVRVDKLDD